MKTSDFLAARRAEKRGDYSRRILDILILQDERKLPDRSIPTPSFPLQEKETLTPLSAYTFGRELIRSVMP